MARHRASWGWHIWFGTIGGAIVPTLFGFNSTALLDGTQSAATYQHGIVLGYASHRRDYPADGHTDLHLCPRASLAIRDDVSDSSAPRNAIRCVILG